MQDIFLKLMFNILKVYMIFNYTFELHNELHFLPERMKIEKVERLVGNWHDKKEYVIHIGNLE